MLTMISQPGTETDDALQLNHPTPLESAPAPDCYFVIEEQLIKGQSCGDGFLQSTEALSGVMTLVCINDTLHYP